MISEVKGIWSKEEMDCFQDKGQKGDKWSEGDLKGGKIKHKGGESWESGKWSEVKGIWSTEEREYFQEQGLESDMWSEFEVGWRQAICSEGKGIKAGCDVKSIQL